MDQQGYSAAGFHRPSSDGTTECIEKVEAMISTAILHQEDVWNMLLSLFPDPAPTAAAEPAGYGDPLALLAAQSAIPEKVKESLEKAMDWCRLGQCRLKALLTEDHSSVGRGKDYTE